MFIQASRHLSAFYSFRPQGGFATRGSQNSLSTPIRPVISMPARGMKITASELKKHMVVERKDGKLYTVVEYIQITPGRRASIMQVEFKELLTGTKVNERLRSEDKLEQVELDDTEAEFLRSEDGKLVFRDKSTMEEVEVDEDLVGSNLVPYLAEGHNYKISRVNDAVVRVLLPPKAAQEVVEIRGQIGKDKGVSDVTAKLANGRTVKVPSHTKVGTLVWVRLPDEVYMTKVAEGDAAEAKARSSSAAKSEEEETN